MSAPAIQAALPLTHLAAMTGEHGLFEHAKGRTPRFEHGYCTDDVARALTVVVHEERPSREARRLSGLYLTFLERAISRYGAAHNRMSADGHWLDRPSTGDCWGRAVAGLGSAVRHGFDEETRARALEAFLRAARGRSTEVRASSFAALGAVDVLATPGAPAAARQLLAACLRRIPQEPGAEWDWPEPTLRYANAALCAALILGGDALGRDATVRRGLDLLTSLLRLETSPAGHLSPTGSAGRAPGQAGPLWDQQPIEPAALAEASMAALTVTGDERWAQEVLRAWAWFAGANDNGLPMVELGIGGGYDGLTPAGRNENCGAESTLAALRTHQLARAAREWLGCQG